MSYAQTLFSFTDTNTIYFGKARQKTKYIAWEHLKRPGVTEYSTTMAILAIHIKSDPF